jgi:uncharacterized protein (TIGR02444 family)
MNPTPMFSKQSLWQFSCDFYAEPSIERSCLALQEEYDLNINMLLFLLWYSVVERRILSSAEIELLLLAMDKPQQWVSEFRLFRKQLWSKMITHSTEPDPEIKQALLSAELKLEQQVISALFDCASLQLSKNTSSESPVQLIELEFIAHENLDAYIELIVQSVSDDLRRLQQDLLARLLQLMQRVQAA